ncbi:hypothetical protein EDD22DRAFT_961088 [Suillus occidentalis]|nr:hypothetical protein EDD22DRAFT_961088 [Suillus occidentalis]
MCCSPTLLQKIRHPYSQTKKKQLASQEKERAITDAINAYKNEQDKPKEERRSLRRICADVKEDWFTKHKKHIVISCDTVSRRLKGGQSCHQFHMETKAWLKPEEEDMVILYCLNLTSRAFPLNHKTLKPDVVTTKMMAPSLETSSKGCLPLPQTSPIKVLTSTIKRYQESVETPSENGPGPATSPFHSPGLLMGVAEQVVEGLASMSAAFLISSSPTKPESAKEQLYQDALHTAYDCEIRYKSSLVSMQSTIVLQSMFCDWLSSQLAAQEEKKQNSKRGGQLIGDGLPRLLTGDEFYHRVVEHQRAAKEEEAGREARQMEREGRAELLKTWKEAEAAWLLERRRPAWNKPKLGKLETLLPRPTLNDPEASEEGQQDSSDEEDADENDGDESDGGTKPPRSYEAFKGLTRPYKPSTLRKASSPMNGNTPVKKGATRLGDLRVDARLARLLKASGGYMVFKGHTR